MHHMLMALTKEQRDWLGQEAKKHGISMVELMRRLIDKARGIL